MIRLTPRPTLFPYTTLFRSYRLTGEPRYLGFCKYILRAWEQPNGPHIISTLLTQKRVDKVGNGKAYEMLSRSEEHTSELQSLRHLVCRLLLEKKNDNIICPY